MTYWLSDELQELLELLFASKTAYFPSSDDRLLSPTSQFHQSSDRINTDQDYPPGKQEEDEAPGSRSYM